MTAPETPKGGKPREPWKVEFGHALERIEFKLDRLLKRVESVEGLVVFYGHPPLFAPGEVVARLTGP